MQTLRILLVVGLTALLASCVSGPKAPPAAGGLVFAVLGDIPYSDDDAQFLVQEIVPAIKKGAPPFVIHLGDMKSGGAPCTAETDAALAALIASLAPIPVFYTPGDNEWTDCDRFNDPVTGKPQSELQRLARVRAMFFATPPDAPDQMRLRAQAFQKENLTWRYNGVRFATVHVVATNNGRSEIAGDDPAMAGNAADQRDAANLAWLANAAATAKTESASALVIAMQADMTDVSASVLGQACTGAQSGGEKRCDAFVALREAVREAAVTFGGPTLLLHGDTAAFTLGQSFAGDEAANLWVLNAAGDHGVTGEGFHYGVLDATLVTIQPGAAAPFLASGFVTGALAEEN